VQTGAPLYYPQVGKSPKREGVVFERLYGLSQAPKPAPPATEQPPRQNRVYEEAKFRRVMELFERLDSDRDG
jgi:hypothetical protein